MSTNTSGTRKTLKALSTVFQGVVRMSSSVSESEVLTRSRRKRAAHDTRSRNDETKRQPHQGGPGVMKNRRQNNQTRKEWKSKPYAFDTRVGGIAERQPRISTKRRSR